MTNCQKNALGRDVMTAEQVEAYYRKAKPAGAIQAALVCESHERLRAELEGAKVLIDDGERRFATLTAQLNTALDAGLAHADNLARWREGLLRIFARAPDWSGECAQANVSDLLGMTVKEVQDEIDSTNGA